MIQPQSCIPSPGVSEIIPERIDTLVRVKFAESIRPSLREEALERVSDLDPEQSVVEPSLGLVDIKFGGHDIVVAGQHNRSIRCQQFRSIADQTVKPAQLVVELWTGGGISVRKIEATNEDAIYRRLDIAAVAILRVPRESPSSLDRVSIPCQYRNAVSALLTIPDTTIACFTNGAFRKFLVRRLEFLQTDRVRLRFSQPAQQERQASIYPVDVERRYFHGDYQTRNAYHSGKEPFRSSSVPARLKLAIGAA